MKLYGNPPFGVLVAALFLSTATGAYAALPSKQSNVGDSISQGFDAYFSVFPSDQPEESWVQGTDAAVHSVYLRYHELNASFTQEPESVSGAEMVGGSDNFAAQASRICKQSLLPQHVSVLLGGNDVCNRAVSSNSDATANLYAVETFINGLRAGLNLLAGCLPQGSSVFVLTMPRVDKLYTSGNEKSPWCPVVWSSFGICPIVTAETNAARRDQIGQRVDDYNSAIANEIEVYNANTNRKNLHSVAFFTDWVGSIHSGFQNTSVGTHPFTANELSDLDCFHPNVAAQKELACIAWSLNPDSGETRSKLHACFSP